jgi:hypothetical protein
MTDRNEIERAVELLFDSEQVVELRTLGPNRSGFYRVGPDLVEAAVKASDTSKQTYVTLQRVAQELIHRGPNVDQGQSTKDTEVEGYQWLLVDCDAKKYTGIAATKAEREAPLFLSVDVTKYLTGRGFPPPIHVDTGNGYALLYRLEDADASLVQHVLQHLNKTVVVEGAGVDLKVFNPSRIWGLPGTWNRKGTGEGDRPWRLRMLREVPDVIEAVSRETLEALVAVPEGKFVVPAGEYTGPEYDIPALCEQYGWDILRIKRDQLAPRGGLCTKYELTRCPLEDPNDPHHYVEESPGVVLIKYDEGAVAFDCQHDHCAGKDWNDLKLKYEIGMERDEDEPNELGYTQGSSRSMKAKHYFYRDLWPAETVTTEVGKDKVGKTTLAKTLMGRVTLGTLPGDFEGQPGAVLISSFEEDFDGDVLPVLNYVGADTDLVFHVEAYTMYGEAQAERYYRICKEIEEKYGVAVAAILLDGVKDFMKGKGDAPDYDAMQVRQFLQPLMALSRELTLGILAVAHPKKSGGNLGEMSGSPAWQQVPRQVLGVTSNRVEVYRSNYGNKGFTLPIMGESAIIGADDNGKEITAWRTRFLDSEPPSQATGSPSMGSGTRPLAGALKVGASNLGFLLEQAVQEAALRRQQGGPVLDA